MMKQFDFLHVDDERADSDSAGVFGAAAVGGCDSAGRSEASFIN